MRDILWSCRAEARSADGHPATRTAAFEERLMTGAIVIALVGVGLAVVGLVRGG